MDGRKRDQRRYGAGDAAVDGASALLLEFPPVAIAVGVAVGVGLLGFLAWKVFPRHDAQLAGIQPLSKRQARRRR
jgi:hypothetical protein